jgi:hypothetical protein
MATDSPLRDRQPLLARASLVIGPLLMAIGDLIHPQERMAAADQIVILAEHASRWYAAHLLLFAGIVVFIPGMLALSAVAASRRPAAGHAARILVLMGTAGFASIFVAEMLVGRYVLDGASPAAAAALLETMFSGPMLAAVGPVMLAFVAGTAAFAIPLIRAGGGLRWSAAAIAAGMLLILVEIATAQVLLSQIGNVLIFVGSTGAAMVLKGPAASPIRSA